MSERQPARTERPAMPGYGIDPGPEGLLPWSWAVERLTRAHGYWLATTDADGASHIAAVWGVWFLDTVCFSTGGRSRKAVNLTRDPRCSMTTGDPRESIVVRGFAQRITDASPLDRMRAVYRGKYGEGFPDPADSPVFAVVPEVAFGIVEADFATSATRWTFSTQVVTDR
jgi:hypothetical protein